MTSTETPKDRKPAHKIVFGNEKGGSGKSTAAMHVAVALLRLGYKVGTIDLDARQGTLTRYMKNRWDTISKKQNHLPMPTHMDIEQSKALNTNDKEAEEKQFFSMACSELERSCDFIIIDTPGTHNHLSRIAHQSADTLVTPLNDSFVDLDLLARVDPETYDIIKPSVYAEMVESVNVERIDQGGKPIHWIVMRNRLTHYDAHNKKNMGKALEKLSLMLGFQLVSGMGERVVFRELFLRGMTLLDLRAEGASLSLSELSARQEVRALVTAIAPEKIRGHARPPKTPRFSNDSSQKKTNIPSQDTLAAA